MIAAHGNSLRSIIMHLDKLTSQEVFNICLVPCLPFANRNWCSCDEIVDNTLSFLRLSALSCLLAFLCCIYLRKGNLSGEEVLRDLLKQVSMLIPR